MCAITRNSSLSHHCLEGSVIRSTDLCLLGVPALVHTDDNQRKTGLVTSQHDSNRICALVDRVAVVIVEEKYEFGKNGRSVLKRHMRRPGETLSET